MKTKILITLIIAYFINYNLALSQATIQANAPVSGAEYLGWDNGSNKIVDVKNEANQSIKFYTNAGPATFNNLRMIIAQGASTMSGFVGIGTNFSNPQSRLHLSQPGDSTCWFQMTGNRIGNSASDGLRIGILNPNGGPFDVEIRQQENASIKFYTTDSTSIKDLSPDGSRSPRPGDSRNANLISCVPA